jgi:hypothetical protein
MGQTEYTIKITPEGDVYFLYDDNSPLRNLGKIELRRASNVEWDVEEQVWVVWLNDHIGKDGKVKRKRLQPSFEYRIDAIKAEILILNERLKNGEQVDKLFLGVPHA